MKLKKDETIFVAGHRGMVGSAIYEKLKKDGFEKVIGRTRSELDLLNRDSVRSFFEQEKPSVVVVAAAKVGGILANSEQPVEFLLQNLAIQNNLIEAAADFGSGKLLFLGSSCIYPKMAPQPLNEDALLTGPLEPTNDAYAIAKIAGIKLCQSYNREYAKNFISAMPTNLYGPRDNYDLHNSHVLPALIRKVHDAKKSGAGSIMVWGSGQPRREFLHTTDLAEACVFLLENYDQPELVTIRNLAETVCDIIGFDGKLEFDTSKPDGTPRKLLDISKIKKLGWSPKISLREGIADAYAWFQKHYGEARL